MKQYIPALNIATTNCEADIVYGIISEMRKAEIPMIDIISACAAVEGAISFLVSYAQQRKMINPSDDTLSNIFEIARRLDPKNPAHQEPFKKLSAYGIGEVEEIDQLIDNLHVVHIKDLEKRVSLLLTKTAKTSFPRIKPFIGADMDYQLIKSHEYLGMKKKGTDLGDKFLRSDSIFNTIMLVNEKAVLSPIGEGIAKKLNLDRKQYTLVRLRAAAKCNDWGQYMEIIKKEKPKINPQFFAQTCMEFGNKELAVIFIKQITSPEDKVSMLLDIE